MERPKQLNVTSLVWEEPPGQVHIAQGNVLKNLGYTHRFLYYDDPIPPDTDFTLIQGPYGPILPFFKNLINLPSSCRPVVVYWFQQSFDFYPGPKVRQALSPLFSDFYQHYCHADRMVNFLRKAIPQFFGTKGKRLGFFGDILWLHHHGLVDVLVLSSNIYQEYLAHYGIQSLVIPRGYHSTYGQSLNDNRDIAAVWMGKLRTKRRRRAVYGLLNQLEKRGQKMLIFDGVEKPFIFGQKRTEILNRAWFVPNIYFSDPTNELSIRFYVAGANGAVTITEPLMHNYPFVPDKHLVESSIKEMPDKIIHYIENKEEWQRLSGAMLQHLKNDLQLDASIAAIMAEAKKRLTQDRFEQTHKSFP